MGSIPITRSNLLIINARRHPAVRAVLLVLCLGAGSARALSPEDAPGQASDSAPANPLASKARALYFSSDVLQAAEAFEAAVKVSSGDWRVWVDGAIAWAEAGRPEKAIAWQRRAADLEGGAESRAAVGWALLRADEPEAADAEFARALASNPESAYALLGAGRTKLELNRPREATQLLEKASQAGPGQSLTDYYLGNAYEALHDESAANEAYKRVVSADSYFHEGRLTLSRSYLRLGRYQDAWRHLQRVIDADPGSRLAHAMLDKVRPLIARLGGGQPAATTVAPLAETAHETEPWTGKVPAIRVGVSSTQMGRPRARRSATVRSNGAWRAYDKKTGRLLFTAEPGEFWTVRLIPGKRTKKSRGHARLEWRSAEGAVAAVPGEGVVLRGVEPETSLFNLQDDPDHYPRAFRGELEFEMYGGRRTIRVVNTLGLEDYTHGVVSAEMPQRAPLEALKSQAVMARTHALHIMTATRRHRREGYDICDEQHCQVYGGVRSETERTRAVVSATRGRIAVYRGKPAHVIYSSHCGGRTQSGTDVGWGEVPYWRSVEDSPLHEDAPATPLELRRYLSDWPKGFDRPSSYVHPAHARWMRAIPAKELGEKLNRKFRIGALRGLRVLKRAPSGNVKAMLILGTRTNRKITDEMAIRSLLGIGSLRSTLFVLDTEYRKTRVPAAKGKSRKKTAEKLVPETFVFRGGGWGHAVGLCQSGAMGRAEAGQSYEDIVKAYFPGVEIGSAGY